jgi:hypothetical protein
MEFERLYIIDPTNFKGWVNNTMSAPKGMTPTHVDYRETPTTFEEYKKEKGNENLIALTWEEFEEKYYNPYLKSLQGDWKEISEEHWYDMLEVLPPRRWTQFGKGNSFFFISEAYTADLHTCFVKVDGKCFEALRSVFLPTEEILKQIECHAKK